MTAAAADRETSFYHGEQVEYPVEAAKKIYAGTMVCLNVARYAVPAEDTAGFEVVGIAEKQADNSSGGQGDINVRVRRCCVHRLIAAGLVAADAKKPVWVLDDQTVTLTPKNVFAGILARYKSAAVAEVDITPAIIASEAAALGLELRAPSDIETAAFTAAVNATWEDKALVTALNLVLTTPILVGKAVHLRGVMEFINGEAAVNNAKFADGGTPDDDDKVERFTTAAAAASEFLNVDLVTDASGQIKIEVDDKTNLTMKFHLKSYYYVRNAATS